MGEAGRNRGGSAGLAPRPSSVSSSTAPRSTRRSSHNISCGKRVPRGGKQVPRIGSPAETSPTGFPGSTREPCRASSPSSEFVRTPEMKGIWMGVLCSEARPSRSGGQTVLCTHPHRDSVLGPTDTRGLVNTRTRDRRPLSPD